MSPVAKVGPFPLEIASCENKIMKGYFFIVNKSHLQSQTNDELIYLQILCVCVCVSKALLACCATYKVKRLWYVAQQASKAL